MEKTNMMMLSTGHIKEQTVNILNDAAKTGILLSEIVSYKKDGYGYFIVVPEDLEKMEIPEDLKQCLTFAKQNGCEWVCFDCDVEMIPELPVYCWDKKNVENVKINEETVDYVRGKIDMANEIILELNPTDIMESEIIEVIEEKVGSLVQIAKAKNILKNNDDLVTQFAVFWGIKIGSAMGSKEREIAEEMKQWPFEELYNIFSAWKDEYLCQSEIENVEEFFDKQLTDLLHE